MEKTLILILAIFLIVICIVSAWLINKKGMQQDVINYNKTYEAYLDKEILGIDLASLINMAVNENEKNGVQKDQRGYYIENDENSIKIDLNMITIKSTYRMEEIHSSKIENFVKYFNSINFKCTKIEYHSKTGRVAKLVFEELP